MKQPCLPATVLALAMAGAVPAQAASGQIDTFSASALSVFAGATVDFTASYSIVTEQWINGGSDTTEPAPQEGYQEWIQNWYDQHSETVLGVSLQAGGQSFSDYPAVPAGSAYSGSWAFSVVFPVAGHFDIGLSGDWQVDVQADSGQEIATRNCYNLDTEGGVSLWCDSWASSYPQASDHYTWGEAFAATALHIEVLAAPVPEPRTLALALAGGGLLGLGRLSRRRPCRARP